MASLLHYLVQVAHHMLAPLPSDRQKRQSVPAECEHVVSNTGFSSRPI